MKCRDSQNFESISTQIQEILVKASRDHMAKMITYYDQAVIDENDFIHSRNDQLAPLHLSPYEIGEIGEFESNIALKQNTVRTKLGKRRALKTEKPFHPKVERPIGM